MAEDGDPFESPRLLVEGAGQHIDAFRARLLELRASDWTTPTAGPGGEIIVTPKVVVPPDMKRVLFDITNNLRSALDHAVFASTLALTGEERDGTKFPFGDSASEMRGDAKRRCKNVPREMVEFLITFEAHREGNHLLWGLNKLRNTKNHRVLVPVGASADMVGMGEPSVGTSADYEWEPATGRFKARLELTPETRAGGVMFLFRLELLIGTGTFRGEPALGIFDRLRSEVERVVSAIEAETARILTKRVA